MAGEVTQVLTSPNYPEPHEHNLLCNWTITVHHANVIVEITDVNTEPCCDYLEVNKEIKHGFLNFLGLSHH